MTVHPDLLIAQKQAYIPSGLLGENFVQEAESQDYGATEFKMNNMFIRFRAAKITPKKIGQFVTFWKRMGQGPIMPYDSTDAFDYLIVSVRSGERLGQFVFPKAALCMQGYVSKNATGGKLAMRVYPPWDITESRQAQKTQAWQLNYFYEIFPGKPVNTTQIKQLFR